ncbi:MAG: histidine phosphatase family protein, partial [Alphaproteobacteria bacterium]
MTEKTIYIFRHGQTDYNAEKRVMGQLDIQLNKIGINQANELADKMSNKSIQAIYSSPLSRALETAKIVSNKTGAKIITDNALMERNNGKLQGHIVHAT